jgi:hypothetical protein
MPLSRDAHWAAAFLPPPFDVPPPPRAASLGSPICPPAPPRSPLPPPARQVIRDYSTPPGKELIKELQRSINTNVDFLVVCRPMSVSMGNAVRYLKMRLSPAFLPRDIPDVEAKELLLSVRGRAGGWAGGRRGGRAARLARGDVPCSLPARAACRAGIALSHPRAADAG